LTDSSQVFHLSQEDGLMKWMPDQVYRDQNEAANVLNYLISKYTAVPHPDKHPFVLAITLSNTDEVIGHVGLSPYKLGIEIGYAIAEGHSRKGFGTQAVLEISNWAKEKLGVAKIYAVVASENAGSIRVLEKAKYQLYDEAIQNYHGKQLLCRRYCFS
jgi:ribosomal-protein-alanine N-acetyltransferase